MFRETSYSNNSVEITKTQLSFLCDWDKDSIIVPSFTKQDDPFSNSHSIKIRNKILDICEKHGIKRYVAKDYPNIWLRDLYYPNLFDGVLYKFDYDYSYMRMYEKTVKETFVLKHLNDPFFKDYLIQNMGIKIDGGNIINNHNMIVCTKKGREIKKVFDNVFYVNHEKEDIIGHSDGICRFINDNTLLINENHKISEKLRSHLKKNNIDLVEFPVDYFDDNYDHMYTANGIYINFLQMKNFIIIPIHSKIKDKIVHKMQDLLNNYGKQTYFIDTSSIACGGGNLNCVSYTFKGK